MGLLRKSCIRHHEVREKEYRDQYEGRGSSFGFLWLVVMSSNTGSSLIPWLTSLTSLSDTVEGPRPERATVSVLLGLQEDDRPDVT